MLVILSWVCSSRSWMRSKVVKRAPQAGHDRRRVRRGVERPGAAEPLSGEDRYAGERHEPAGGEGQAADHGKALPAECFLDHRRLAAGSPGVYPGGADAQSAFVDEDEGSALFAGLFLSRATGPASNGGSWARRVRSRDVPGVGN